MKKSFFILFLAISASNAFSLSKMSESPTLYQGTRSVEGEFLPMGWLGFCTATVVGEKMIFTAAHCVRTGQKVNFRSRFDQKSYAMTCRRHPRYNDRTVYNDYAFCKLDSGEFPKEMPKSSFENRTPVVGEKMLLNGYGAPTVGTHHWGPETVTRFGNQDIVACGRVYLGGGDSGGSLLTWTEDRSGKSGFKVIGVNSRAGGGCSYFNRISHSEFQTWAKDYETAFDVKLCGFSATCAGVTPPSPPRPPVNCRKTYEDFEFCLGSKGILSCVEKATDLKGCVQ